MVGTWDTRSGGHVTTENRNSPQGFALVPVVYIDGEHR